MLTAEEEKILTLEAGQGLPPSIFREEALAYYKDRAEDAKWLADQGIQLIPPAEHHQ